MDGSKIVEICCGSYFDCVAAYNGGAGRVELNIALHMDGLTPSLGSLQLTKRKTGLKVICMLRPRGGGFAYSDADYDTMLCDATLLMQNGSDGIAFGCLNKDRTIDEQRVEELIAIIKSFDGEAVFHKAFDCVADPFSSIEKLINLGIDRVLTSGLQPKAPQGQEMLKQLQCEYGSRIEIMAGGGITVENAREITQYTGVSQIHSSCKDWLVDATTVNDNISFSYMKGEYANQYEVVDASKVNKLVNAL